MAKAQEESKELVGTGAASVPSFLAETIDADSGIGNSMSAQDNTTPFLGILQSNSPQLEENKPEYIDGAKKGMLFNTATKEVWDGKVGVPVIAFGFLHVFNEWVPRTAGGGFVQTLEFDTNPKQRYKAKDRIIDGKRRGLMLDNGNDLVETDYTGIFLPNSPMPAILAATSTGLKPMRDWMTLRNNVLINGKIAPAFARKYLVQTVYQENESGAWHNWKISLADWVSQEEYERAKKFAQLMANGEFQIGRPPEPASDEDSKDDVPV